MPQRHDRQAAAASHDDGSTQLRHLPHGMNQPSATAPPATSAMPVGGPQIAYSNTLACGDAGCHGKVANHVGTPISAAACITCHTDALRRRSALHEVPHRSRRASITAPPRRARCADCAGCHNGSIAATPPNHASLRHCCATCHTGMNSRPMRLPGAATDEGPGAACLHVVYTNDLTCGLTRAATRWSQPLGHADQARRLHDLSRARTTRPRRPAPRATARSREASTMAPPRRLQLCCDCAACHDGTIAPAKQSRTPRHVVTLRVTRWRGHQVLLQATLPQTAHDAPDLRRRRRAPRVTAESARSARRPSTLQRPPTVGLHHVPQDALRGSRRLRLVPRQPRRDAHGTATLADTTDAGRGATGSRLTRRPRSTGSLRAAGKALARAEGPRSRLREGAAPSRRSPSSRRRARRSLAAASSPAAVTEYRAVWRRSRRLSRPARPAVRRGQPSGCADGGRHDLAPRRCSTPCAAFVYTAVRHQAGACEHPTLRPSAGRQGPSRERRS